MAHRLVAGLHSFWPRPNHDSSHLDFRVFVDALRKDGDLAEINDEVDPHLEVAAITRRVYERRAKTPLFNNVKAASLEDIIDRMLSAKKTAPIPPIHVSTGPCKERKILGEDVDLTKLPVPLLNKADGGDYIQTLGINIVQHLTEPWTNWSIARAMIHDKNRMADVPYAIALGAPPIAVMAASMPLPAGVTEAEYVGSLCGSPLELVKCETNDIYVPANSEIVLEGTISVTDRGKEGLFGEMHGYSFLDEELDQPLYKVNAITHRENAILPLSVPGRATGPDETHTMIGTLASAKIRQLLQDNVHRLLVVGDDINPFNFNDVMWAFATRCRPSMDEFHFADVDAYPLVPYMSHGPGTKLTGGKVVGNCLLPLEYEMEQNWVTCDFANGYPEDVKEKVLERWDRFGLE
ncbi:UbiD-domain-containing protein [Mytilinidion resinicola]|uniref:UbiD-domain-containing protein n=1 Tax=Mytilinidion resinicola TaxID=574789 RepID=A0A6A6YYX6_9PEZI|nr:UbiD-domain-containing protein [Mytilinidion resinicola]KAF2813643.1 UbiD-domain-containing protein [Mytilinidion resinicola]